MSGSSDSDEYYDAEESPADKRSSDIFPLRKPKTVTLTPSKSESDFQTTLKQDEKTSEAAAPPRVPNSLSLQTGLETTGVEKIKRHKLKEVRKRMQTEDEETFNTVGASPTSSQTSSFDGVYPGGSAEMSAGGRSLQQSHPFRIIEHDALSLHSLTSLGRPSAAPRIPSLSSADQSGGKEPGGCSDGGFGGSTSTLRCPSNERDDEVFKVPSSAPPPPSTSPSAEEEVGERRRLSPEASPSACQSVHQLQEPDVIASTKPSNNNLHHHHQQTAHQLQEEETEALGRRGTGGGGPAGSSPPAPPVAPPPPPVAPPRKRKKKGPVAPPVPPSSLSLHQAKDEVLLQQSKLVKSSSVEESSSYRRSTLPSPASTVESITREFEHSLDLSAAIKGECHVKIQENPEERGKPSVGGGRVKRSGTCSRNSSTYPLGGGGGGGTGGGAGGGGAGGGSSAQRSGGGGSTRERRRSAGDEQTLLPNQLNMFRAGSPLSDLVTVLNLDTGERVPLSIAEDKLPQCINPLSLHIMRITSEYVSNSSLEKGNKAIESDEESVSSKVSRRGTGAEEEEGEGKTGVRSATAQLKKFFGSTVKKTMIRAKTIGRHNREDTLDVESEGGGAGPTGEQQYIKLKASNSHKGPYEFDCVLHVQELSGTHVGPVWCMKFSACGRLLATAGQDRVLRIWVIRSAYPYFQEMWTKYNEKVSPSPSQESLVSAGGGGVGEDSLQDPEGGLGSEEPGGGERAPFMPRPFCTYRGHTSDLLDVSWSKNYFILSSSMDKTVRLWHISRKECLCCFQHIDFVTAIVFHPKDDRFFLSGSLDGKLRLWNIPDKKVAVWNEIDGPAKLITAANFCQNGKFAVVGSYDGRCIFYTMDQLKYHTQIHVRSTRGKNSTGRKISGIEPMPGEDKILVTSNDSRIRLYDLRDLNLSCKYKGYANFSSQIKASFSHDGKFIVSGSENQCIYIWKSNHDYSKFSSVRRDRNDYWEGIKVHNAVVTCAVFSPNPELVMRQIEEAESAASGNSSTPTSGYVLVSADFNGIIKVFINKTKPKHSSLPASAMA